MNKSNKFIDYPEIRRFIQAGTDQSKAVNGNVDLNPPASNIDAADTFKYFTDEADCVKIIQEGGGNARLATRTLAKKLKLK
jgi:hypothetical protein